MTGVAAGTANITYTVGGCKSSVPVTITPKCREANGSLVNDDNGAMSYTLYPNPAQGLVSIEQSIAVDQTSAVRVLNYAGQTTFAGSISFIGGKAQLDLGNVAPGVYLVEMRDKQGVTTTFKVVVEK